jgi:hypothetical protein
LGVLKIKNFTVELLELLVAHLVPKKFEVISENNFKLFCANVATTVLNLLEVISRYGRLGGVFVS